MPQAALVGWLRWGTGLLILAVVTSIAFFVPEIQEIRGASAEPIPDGELGERINTTANWRSRAVDGSSTRWVLLLGVAGLDLKRPIHT